MEKHFYQAHGGNLPIDSQNRGATIAMRGNKVSIIRKNVQATTKKITTVDLVDLETDEIISQDKPNNYENLEKNHEKIGKGMLEVSNNPEKKSADEESSPDIECILPD